MWSSKFIFVSIDDMSCDSDDDCENGGSCLENEDDDSYDSCQCPEGFSGAFCESTFNLF